MKNEFDYDYFDRKRDKSYDGFYDEEDFDYEFSDELFPEDNRYLGEFDDYDY